MDRAVSIENKLQQTVVVQRVIGGHLASVSGAASGSTIKELLYSAKCASQRYEESLKKQQEIEQKAKEAEKQRIGKNLAADCKIE